jgi:hypothetical protein
MTRLMEQAIARASQLPQEGQDAIAAIILRELESEARWEELFSRRQSEDLLSQMADEAMSEVQSGQVRKLDLADL